MTVSDCTLPSGERPTLSLEFFPARGEQQLANNVIAVRRLLKTKPDFVSVTYGASGSSQGGSLDLVKWIVASGTDTYAHLTCYATSLSDLRHTIIELITAGVTGILALRGDAPAEGQRLVLPHANYLVSLIREVAADLGTSVHVVVAAYPTGHPESASLTEDAQNVKRKQDAGAKFAITQNFFEVHDYERFAEETQKAGVTIPVVPGLMIATSLKQLLKISELSGLTVPNKLARALSEAQTAADRQAIAVENTVELAHNLARSGAPGIQLFTMNNAPATLRVMQELGVLLNGSAELSPIRERAGINP